MRAQLEKRVGELRAELKAGQEMLAELEAKQTHLRSTLLRISGAIQVLEELLNQEPTEKLASVNGESDTGIPATAVRE